MLLAKAISRPLSHKRSSPRLLHSLLPCSPQLGSDRLTQIIGARAHCRSLGEGGTRLSIAEAVLTGAKELVLLFLRLLHESSWLLICTRPMISPFCLLPFQMCLKLHLFLIILHALLKQFIHLLIRDGRMLPTTLLSS